MMKCDILNVSSYSDIFQEQKQPKERVRSLDFLV